MYVSIFNKVSAEDCVFYPPPIHTNWNASFGGAYTFYGNQIFVAGGCRAVFDVCGSGKHFDSTPMQHHGNTSVQK